MLDRVISGGQTGADQGGLRAARAAGIATGGWAPKDWLTEDGSAPWLADFGLLECEEPGYVTRRRRNLRDADAILLFGDVTTPGSKSLMRDAGLGGKLIVDIEPGLDTPGQIIRFL